MSGVGKKRGRNNATAVAAVNTRKKGRPGNLNNPISLTPIAAYNSKSNNNRSNNKTRGRPGTPANYNRRVNITRRNYTKNNIGFSPAEMANIMFKYIDNFIKVKDEPKKRGVLTRLSDFDRFLDENPGYARAIEHHGILMSSPNVNNRINKNKPTYAEQVQAEFSELWTKQYIQEKRTTMSPADVTVIYDNMDNYIEYSYMRR